MSLNQIINDINSFNLENKIPNLDKIISLIKNNDIYQAYLLILETLTTPFDDDSYVYSLLKLQSLCESIDDEKYIHYDELIVNTIGTGLKSNNSVMVTMTTCKRIELFEKTVNSFLACCTDLNEYLYKWVVVDDNSSESDISLMKTKYPFMKIICKTEENKGHPISMNILRDEILESNVSYFFHLEDDWRFFVKDKYITKCLSVLNDNNKYGQCLINKSYGEDMKSLCGIGGGYRRYTSSTRYYIHEYLVNEAMRISVIKLNTFKLGNCSYWPHYSLRVGLTRTEVLKKVGKFDVKANHFEMDYAYKYISKGYITAYLDNIYCTHIGRRTYEREGNKLNAYDLNNVSQFGTKIKKEIQSSDNSSDNSSEKYKKTVKIYVINLERRPDRLDSFRRLNGDELVHFNVLNAIDGMKLNKSHCIQKIFEHNDYNFRRGIVGCALSHIKLWNELLYSDVLNSLVILEDDAVLTNNFISKLLNVISDSKNADIIFLGYHPYPVYDKDEYYDRNTPPTTELWSLKKSIEQNMGGTTGYYITKNGAKNMIEWIDKYSVINAIDWVMFKTASINNIYYCSPFLVFAECFQKGNIDTDIQNIYEGVGYKDNNEWFIDEIYYWGEKGVCNKFDCMTCDEDKGSKLICRRDVRKDEIITNISIFLNTEKIKEEIRLYPVFYYIVGCYLFSIPENQISERDLCNKVFFDHHI